MAEIKIDVTIQELEKTINKLLKTEEGSAEFEALAKQAQELQSRLGYELEKTTGIKATNSMWGRK